MKKGVLVLVLALVAAFGGGLSAMAPGVRADGGDTAAPPVSAPPDNGGFVVGLTPAANADALGVSIAASGASPLSKVILRAYLINAILYLRLPGSIGNNGACLLLDQLWHQVVDRSQFDLGLRSRAIAWLVTVVLIERSIPCR